MQNDRIADPRLALTLEAIESTNSFTAAARKLGINRKSLFKRRKRLAALGLLGYAPVQPGFEIKQISSRAPDGSHVKQVRAPGAKFEPLPGHTIKGESALVGPDGRILAKWIKTSAATQGALDAVAVLTEAFKDFEGSTAPQIDRARTQTDKDLLALIPCNDWHIGMYAWKPESGENWDLSLAEKVIGEGLDALIYGMRPAETAVVLGGGDLLHSDDNENKTARSGNALDVDGRHAKVLEVATRLMVRAVDRAREVNKNVIVRILPGNHDEHSAVAVAYFLKAWYRNEPRVSIDCDPSLFWWFRFGKVMLGSTHGHTVKPERMPAIMAARRAEDWGATLYRYVHTFHLHHSAKRADEDNGVISEIHQAPIPSDSWHAGAGYLSGRSLQAILYHRNYGEVARSRVAMLDASASA